LLFWFTVAGVVALYVFLTNVGLLPNLKTPPKTYFSDFAPGWSALVFGWAAIGQLNFLVRRWLEDSFVDAGFAPEEAALRRRDRLYHRARHDLFWVRKRVLNLTSDEVLILERRRAIQYWLTTFGWWIVTVGAHLSMHANFRAIAFWTGLALVLRFPFLSGMEGLGFSGAKRQSTA
jgi:hypothetical protein